jgi:glutamate-5-semialdehyde dehydrogenase
MSDIRTLALQCRDAALQLGRLSTQARGDLLQAMAAALEADAPAILAANDKDLQAARDKGVGTAMLDRLALNPVRLAGVANALREVAALPDPVGEVTRDYVRPNGIRWG